LVESLKADIIGLGLNIDVRAYKHFKRHRAARLEISRKYYSRALRVFKSSD